VPYPLSRAKPLATERPAHGLRRSPDGQANVPRALVPSNRPLRPPRPPLRLAAEGCLLLSVVLSVALLGGALPGAVVASSFLGCVALVLVLVDRGGTLSLPPLVLLPLAAAAVCLVQLVPLPAFALAHLGPASSDLRDFALVPLGLTRARPVTLDAPATWLELARALGLTANLTAAAELARSRRSRRVLAAGVGLTGVSVALVGYGHALANAHSLFGLHTFQNSLLPLLTPFGNANHLAGFLTLSTVLLLGLAVEAPERPRMALWLGLAALGGVAVFLSLSRGGIFFFVAGQLAFVVALLLGRVPLGNRDAYRPDSERPGRDRPLVLLASILGVVVLAGYLALDRLAERLSTLDSFEKVHQSKVELWPMFARAAVHVWPLGLGRGAFEVGFPRWQTEGAFYNFTHPENWVLQWATDFGIPATLGLLGVAAWAAFRTVRKDASALERAAACGLLALVFHDLFDFALELQACAAAVAVTAGVLSGRALAEGRGLRLRRPQAWAFAAGCVLLTGIGVWRGREGAEKAAVALIRAAANGVDSEALRTQAVAAIDAHPAEASLYRTVGLAEARRRPHEALAFLNRALWLRPLDADTHRATANVLIRLGAPAQAMGEWRLARETSPEVGRVLAEALPYARTPELLALLVGVELTDTPTVVSLLWAAGRRADAEALLTWARGQAEGRPGLAMLWTRAASLRLQAGEPADALPLLDEAERRGDDVALLRAQALFALGKQHDAIQTLEAAIVRRPEDAELGFALASQWLAAGRPALARQALDRLRPFLYGGPERVRLLATEAESYRMEGRIGRALESLDTARRLAPENAGLQYQAAQLYEQEGRFDAASEAVRAGARADSPAGVLRAQAWLERLQKGSQAQQLKGLETPSPLQKLLDEDDAEHVDAGVRTGTRSR
jgi:tetratricopeptide (TPR) repeat protein